MIKKYYMLDKIDKIADKQQSVPHWLLFKRQRNKIKQSYQVG